jgi:hypothetical protein
MPPDPAPAGGGGGSAGAPSFEAFSALRRRQQSARDTNALVAEAAAAGVDPRVFSPAALAAAARDGAGDDGFQAAFATRRLFLLVVLFDLVCAVFAVVHAAHAREIEEALTANANPTAPRVLLPLFRLAGSVVHYAAWVLALASFAELVIYGAVVWEEMRGGAGKAAGGAASAGKGASSSSSSSHSFSWLRAVDGAVVLAEIALLAGGAMPGEAARTARKGRPPPPHPHPPHPHPPLSLSSSPTSATRLIAVLRMVRVSDTLELAAVEVASRGRRLQGLYESERNRSESLLAQAEQLTARLDSEAQGRRQAEKAVAQLAAQRDELEEALVIAAEEQAQMRDDLLAARAAADAAAFRASRSAAVGIAAMGGRAGRAGAPPDGPGGARRPGGPPSGPAAAQRPLVSPATGGRLRAADEDDGDEDAEFQEARSGGEEEEEVTGKGSSLPAAAPRQRPDAGRAGSGAGGGGGGGGAGGSGRSSVPAGDGAGSVASKGSRQTGRGSSGTARSGGVRLVVGKDGSAHGMGAGGR